MSCRKDGQWECANIESGSKAVRGTRSESDRVSNASAWRLPKKLLKDEDPGLKSMCKNWRLGSTSTGGGGGTDRCISSSSRCNKHFKEVSRIRRQPYASSVGMASAVSRRYVIDSNAGSVEGLRGLE